MWKAAPVVALLLLLSSCDDSPDPVTVATEADAPSPSPSPIETPEEEEPSPEAPELVTVPDVEGQRLAEARRDLREAGLGVTVSKRPSDETQEAEVRSEVSRREEGGSHAEAEGHRAQADNSQKALGSKARRERVARLGEQA
jgi:hypothetical protein